MYYLIEGTDGCGKTTVMRAVALELLRLSMKDFVLTKEPGGPKSLFIEWGKPEELRPFFGQMYETGPLVRELCVNHPEITPLSKRALYRADSLSNWELVVKPAIADDKVVLSDRGWISDLAYGAVLCNLDLQALYQFNMALTPQLGNMTHVIYLDVPSDVREDRLKSNMADHMDKLGKCTRDLLDVTYKQLIPQYVRSNQYWYVDAGRSVEAVVADVVSILKGA